MGRYVVKNCKEPREAAAIMEKAAEKAVRKRKIDDVELEPSSTSVDQLKARRLSVNSAAVAETASADSTCGSVGSGSVSASSCSSSRSSSEVAKENCSFADLEEEKEELTIATEDSVDYCFKEARRGMAASSVVRAELGEPEFKTRPYELSSQRCSKVEKMPTELELEEFFAAAEMNLQKQFIDKYNFDIVKDEPLEGRYEWVEVQLKP